MRAGSGTDGGAQYFIANVETLTKPASDSTLNWLRITSPPSVAPGTRCLFLPSTIAASSTIWRSRSARPKTRLPTLKRLLVEAVAQTEERLQLHGSIGALIDDNYGEDALHAAAGRAGG